MGQLGQRNKEISGSGYHRRADGSAQSIPGGCSCFLRTDSPFPIETRVELFLCVVDCRFRTEGKIRIMHPEFGMGAEFASKTQEHQRLMEAIIGRLTLTHGPLTCILSAAEATERASGGASSWGRPADWRQTRPATNSRL